MLYKKICLRAGYGSPFRCAWRWTERRLSYISQGDGRMHPASVGAHGFYRNLKVLHTKRKKMAGGGTSPSLRYIR